MPRNYIIGNWKMNQSLNDIETFFNELKIANLPEGNFWIAPQAVHLERCTKNNSNILIGTQNCSQNDSGAFTGEISPWAIKELKGHFVIIGHSERRALFNETDTLINLKVKKALEHKLVAVLCIGETLQEREENKTLEVVLNQLQNGLSEVFIQNECQVLIAYEPVWAIGTGKTATPDQAEEVHMAIRKKLIELYPDFGENLSILYGGSVNPSNIEQLLSMPNINGGLVGGASLKSSDFSKLCFAAAKN